LTREAIADAAASAAAGLAPGGDYKGSSEYRRAMAETLATRALMRAAASTE